VLFVQSQFAQALPELKAVRSKQAPVIDGNLEDAVWRGAAIATGFVEKRSQNLARVQTKVLFLYDDDNLYLAFRCEEPNPAGIKAATKEGAHEKAVWGGDDVIAIFIQPDESRETYYQYALTAGGLRFEQKNCPEGVLYEEYAPDWRARTSIGKDSWQAEMKIPFKAIGGGPQMGRTWRMNFLRVRRQTKEASFWAQTFHAHDVDEFGVIKGIVIGAFSKGLRLDDIRLGDAKVGENIFQAKVIAIPASDLKGKLAITSPSGESQSFPAKVTDLLAVPYNVIAEEGEHTVVLELTDGQGNIRYNSPPGTVNLRGLLDCYVERSYYTSEKSAKIVCLVKSSVDRATLNNSQLTCELSGTNIVKTEGPPLEYRTVIDLPVSAAPSKEYAVSITLSKGKNTIASQQVSLRKLAPGRGSEVKLVRRDKDGYLLVNGKPFFCIGNFCCYRTFYDVDILQEMAAAGFNLAVLWGSSYTDKDTLDFMDTCQQYGMMTFLSPEHMYAGLGPGKKKLRVLRQDLKLLVGRDPQGSDDEPEKVKEVRAKIKALQELIRKFKDHPALLYYRNLDEPGSHNMPHCETFARIIRDVDPYHPIEVGFGPPATGLKHKCRTETGEIYGTHSYVKHNHTITRGYVRTRITKPICDKDRKLHAGALTGEVSSSERGMTYPEQRCEAFLCVIGGLRGVRWFRGRYRSLECWENVKKVAGQVRKLSPILLEEEIEQNVAVEQPQPEAVYWLLLKHAGKRYILAANSREEKVESVTFALPALKDGTPVNVWFEDRKLDSKRNSFTDKFDEFEVHVYEIGE